MLVETKAKVGVFAIALGAYLPQFPTLVPEFEAQYDAFKKTIPDTVEMIDGGIVTTKELSMEAGDKFRAADVDLVILQLLTYATSYNMLPAVRDLNVPVVLVNVQKRKAPDYANTDTPKWLGELYACGAVGEMVADLERAGKRHAVITGVVEGGDPQNSPDDVCHVGAKHSLVVVEFVDDDHRESAPQPRPALLPGEHRMVGEVGVGHDDVGVFAGPGACGLIRVPIHGGHGDARIDGVGKSGQRRHLISREGFGWGKIEGRGAPMNRGEGHAAIPRSSQ